MNKSVVAMDKLKKTMPENGGIIPTNFNEAAKFADLLAKSEFVPEHLRGKPSECFLIVTQACNWGVNPLIVAQCTSVVYGKICYEGKLIAGIINSSRKLKANLNFTYEGSADSITCTASGTLAGESEPRTTQTRLDKVRTKNNKNWETNPRQQLAYRAMRDWGRVHMPELMLGIYAPEDVEEGPLKNITPSASVDEINADLADDNAIPSEFDMSDEEIKQKIQEAFLKHKADLEKKYIELSLPVPRNDKSWLNELDKYLTGFYEYKNIILFEDGFENFENGFSQWALSEYKN